MICKNTDSRISWVRSTLILLTILSLFSACKAYHLGSPAEIPFRSLYVKPVTNQIFAPQAQSILSTMLRENFLQDIRIQLVANEADADAILCVELTDYESNATARNQQDTTIADVFDLTLQASVSLLSSSDGTYFFKDRLFQATTNAYTANPYQSSSVINYQLSERQAMEQLSQELSQVITNEVLSPW